MKNLKLEFENKITTLESTIAAKDFHIKQLVFFHTFGMECILMHDPVHIFTFL